MLDGEDKGIGGCLRVDEGQRFREEPGGLAELQQSDGGAEEVVRQPEASGQEAGSGSIETTGETAEEVHAETSGVVNSNCLS